MYTVKKQGYKYNTIDGVEIYVGLPSMLVEKFPSNACAMLW